MGELQFIGLKGKTPVEKFKNGGRPFNEVSHHKDIGLIIPEGFVVLDVDNKEQAEVLLEIVNELDIKCKVMQTKRGMHFWFRSPQPMKNHTHIQVPIGITVDVRSYGRAGYVKIKTNGKMRKWLKKIDQDKVQSIPFWLIPHRSSKDLFKLGEGSRNTTLFTYIPKLQAMGLSKDQIKETLSIINNFVFKESLSESELDVIMRDEAFENQVGMAAEAGFFEDGKFHHNKFGDFISSMLLPITVNSTMYIYKDGYYTVADREAERKMVQLLPTVKRAQRTETLEYMKLTTLVDKDDLDINPYMVNLINGRLDIRTDELLDFTPYAYDFNKIPVRYDPEAYNETLDKTLDKVFCNDKEIRQLFEEFVGYLLLGNNKFGKMILMLGDGANGKSTILELLKTFIGHGNYSTLALEEIGEKFKTAELSEKLLNIGDDIDAGAIKMTGVLKKTVTGEEITVENKGEHPFILRNKAKMMFSANKLPHISDKSYGMERRLLIIPMDARFTAHDDDFDPFIEDKIKTPEALSYLLNLGLKGIKEVFKRNAFIVPQRVRRELYRYKVSNSYTLTWIRDQKITMSYLTDNPVSRLYSEFASFMVKINVKQEKRPNLKTFQNELRDEFNLKIKDIGNDKKAEYIFEKTEKSPDIDILIEY
jgi:putative DNA primase/helicase